MSQRHALRIVQVLLLLALFRYIWLAAYVHPFADDLSYAVAGMRSGLWVRLAQEYASWNGRYFSNILLLKGPLVLGMEHGLWLYRTASVLLIILTWYASHRLMRVLIAAPQEVCATLALLQVMLFMQVMPDVCEGFYWYTGAMTYQLPNALGMLFIANWVRVNHCSGQRPGIGWHAAQYALAIAIAGCNEVHMAFLLLGSAAMVRLLGKHAPALVRPAWSLLAIAAIAACVVIMAPGNETRGSLFPLRHEPLRTAVHAFAQTGRFALLALTGIPVLLVSLVFTSALHEARARGWVRSIVAPPDKWMALALPFACLFTAMVVTYWPTGLLGQHRTANMAIFHFLPAWFLALAVWEQVHFMPRRRGRPLRFSGHWHWVVVVAAASLHVQGRGLALTRELLDGTMVRYDEAMDARYRAIAAAPITFDGRGVQLPSVEWPTGLKVLPLDTSPEHWMNRSMADYFGRNDLRLTEPSPSP